MSCLRVEPSLSRNCDILIASVSLFGFSLYAVPNLSSMTAKVTRHVMDPSELTWRDSKVG